MRRSTILTVAGLCLAPVVIAATYAGQPLALQPQSRLWFEGTSTIRAFSCSASSFDTRVATSVPDAVSAVLAGTKAVESAQLTVPAANLDCRNGTMNEHMRKALKAKDNPTIVFRITAYDVAKASGGIDGTAVGELTIGGVKKRVTVKAHAAPDSTGALRLTGTYPLKMTEFGLKPPTLMMNTIKVDETVQVRFDLLLKGDVPKV